MVKFLAHTYRIAAVECEDVNDAERLGPDPARRWILPLVKRVVARYQGKFGISARRLLCQCPSRLGDLRPRCLCAREVARAI
jgi:hypothetical protein